jgi:YesN/AraC family two-component response regulator
MTNRMSGPSPGTAGNPQVCRPRDRRPQHALRLAKEQPIHLLVVDVIMPLMKGNGVADRIQAVSPSTKVISMAGYQTADIAHTGRALLIKPFRVESLIENVRAVWPDHPRSRRPGRSTPCSA